MKAATMSAELLALRAALWLAICAWGVSKSSIGCPWDTGSMLIAEGLTSTRLEAVRAALLWVTTQYGGTSHAIAECGSCGECQIAGTVEAALALSWRGEGGAR